MKREGYDPALDHISIFPAFYSVDRTTTVHETLIKSLDKDQSRHLNPDLWVYLTDSSDMPTIHALAKIMARHSPAFWRLSFRFMRPCEIVSFSLTINCYYRN